MAKPQRTEAEQKAIDEWLSKNEVTVCEPLARSNYEDIQPKWGGRKKAAKKEEDK